MAEQFIGQHLLNLGHGRQQPDLYHWLREGKASDAEVDYLIAQNGAIYPVEVKAGKGGSLKSLHQFVFEKNNRIAFRFDLQPPSRQKLSPTLRVGGTRHETSQVSFDLISLPLYAVEEISRFCEPPSFL